MEHTRGTVALPMLLRTSVISRERPSSTYVGTAQKKYLEKSYDNILQELQDLDDQRYAQEMNS
jgi:hypothetical protein